MTSSERTDYNALPRAALLKSLNKLGDKIVREETFSVIFDEGIQKDLLSLLEFYKTSHNSVAYEISDLPDQKYKEAVSKVAQFTFLSKETFENNVLKPFFSLNKDKAIPEGEDLISSLLKFYNEERLATFHIISWLMKPSASTSNPEIIGLCRTTLKSLLSKGLIEKACEQLINLSAINLPNTILKENRNELAFAWIHQNILEQKELAKMIFELVSHNFVKISVENRSKLVSELLKSNFGLNNFEKYNLDSETATLAREAFWFRQSSAIRILDLKGLISASASSSNILSNLNPLKSADLSKISSYFKSELNHELTSPFKFAWSLLVGFLDSLDILDDSELIREYSKIANQSVEMGVFKIIFELLDGNNFSFESDSVKTLVKSLFKDVHISFLSVFDSDRSVPHFQIITEGLIRIFVKENELCEEFWYVDSQFPARTSILKYWINRFPHEFITLIRLLSALASGPVCSEIVSDFLFKGFDHIYIERCSDRGNVIEDYNLSSEVYNLTVEKSMETHTCGVGLILGSGLKGVMMSGFNDRPMVNWSTKIAPFHFLVRILQISQDFSVNYVILELFEKLMSENVDFPIQLYQHLEGVAPVFTQAKVANLPLTLVDLLLFVLEQPNPNALIMSKCLNCLVNFSPVFDEIFFKTFLQVSSNVMDGITNVLKRCVYNVEIDSITFEVFDSVLKFSKTLLTLSTSFKQEFPEECSILLKSLKETVFNFIIDHVGKWRFVSQIHRIRLLAEVCTLILNLETVFADDYTKDYIVDSTVNGHSNDVDSVKIGNNFTLLNAIISLIHDVNQDQDSFKYAKLFSDNGIDVGLYFQCLTRAIDYACDDGNLTIAEYFGSSHIQTSTNGLQSPFNIIANCLNSDYMVLPVLLFFQYVFQNELFALNVRISRESLENLSSSMCKWFKPECRETLPKVRSASLAVLNNTACTRPDIFLFIFGQEEEAFINLFNEGINRGIFDYETRLLTGICSILWTSVSEFTLIINALKRTAKKKNTDELTSADTDCTNLPLIDKLVKLLSIKNWDESITPIRLEIISSIFEILSVELCYFNLTPKNRTDLKSIFEPENFIKKIVSIFNEELPESSFLNHLFESFALFSLACLSLKDEKEFNSKILTSLILLAEGLCGQVGKGGENAPGTFYGSSHIEIVCKVLNFGLLENEEYFRARNSNFFDPLILNLIYNLNSTSINENLSIETDKRLESASLTSTLLLQVKYEQSREIYEMISNVLNILRHFLALKIKNSKKVSIYLKLLIASIGCLSKTSGFKVSANANEHVTPLSSELIHFLRREGVIKTIFSLIRNYKDSDSLILFTSGLCSKYDFIIEELLSNDLIFTTNEDAVVVEDDEYLIQIISLLSIIRIKFDSNCIVSEKISTILYGGFQERLERILKYNKTLDAADYKLLSHVLPLLKLLSKSLENPIESPTTEAFLTNLLELLFKILIKTVTSSDELLSASTGVSASSSLKSLESSSLKSSESSYLKSSESSSLESSLSKLIISTLFTFTFYSNQRNTLRKRLQNLLFPTINYQLQNQSSISITATAQHHHNSTTSQYSSLLYMIIISSKFDKETIEYSKQILKYNCPESIKFEIEKL